MKDFQTPEGNVGATVCRLVGLVRRSIAKSSANRLEYTALEKLCVSPGFTIGNSHVHDFQGQQWNVVIAWWTSKRGATFLLHKLGQRLNDSSLTSSDGVRRKLHQTQHSL